MMNIYESITKIMEEVPAIGKNQVNTQQKFKFRGIDDVMNALQPLLSKHKVFIVPEILEQIREERSTKTGGNLIYSICKIKYKFYAEDGTFIEAITIGEGMDSGDKATNKAMAIAMKYALFQVFCIPTEEMKDPDSETPEESKPKEQTINEEELDMLVTEQEAKTVYALMMSKGLEVEKQLQHNYGISNTKDLTKRQYASILNAIKSMPNKK
ncbi:MAG TPA: single-stranded DNA-binding protein [Firmicutes bacterium]|nr:single-stranded DNA-binding protein [Bacillota bacterium]